MDTSIYPPKFSKVLLTPDPHYIPGYTGYCPQLKYNYGKSYGKLTAELLTSPEVAHSGRLMVSGLPRSAEAVGQSYSRTTPIPGYTGFIPRGRSQFACSYSEMCRKALTDFYHEQQKMSLQKSDKLPVISKYNSYSAQQFQRSSPPLTAINSLISYKPALPFIPIERPYLMDDNDPQKYFISGFTGHVPKARFLIGKGYPITTHQALVQFGKPFSEEPVKEQDSPTIYSKGAVVPSFTGHIPGYRFLYGHTFGQLSQNALEKCGIRRVAREA